MKNNETGEFELVLGNKQLLSGFFIVVILFGVFFTMGYIVGRNSAPSPRMMAAEQAGATGTQEGARPQSASGAAPVAPPTAEQPPAGAADDGTAAEPPQPTTQPAQDPNAPAAAPAQPVQTPAATPPAPAVAAKLPNGLIEPVAGDVYLQVMAVKRPEAEVVLKTLRDKNFRAVLAHGPNELVRVLVGPFSDTSSLGQAKAGLENAGFHPIVRK